MLFLMIAAPQLAQAQLAGTDTSAGDSCAGFPTGATRMTADSDGNGLQVTLVCNGTTWEQEGLVAVSKSGNAPAATANLSDLGDVVLSSAANGDVILYSAGNWYNGAGGGGGNKVIDADGDTSIRTEDDSDVDNDLIRFNAGGAGTSFYVHSQVLPGAYVGPGVHIIPPGSAGGNITAMYIKNSSSVAGENMIHFGHSWGTSNNAGIGTIGSDSEHPHSLYLRSYGDRDIVFETNNAERVRILGENGNVGIGDIAPSAALDVVGDINYTGVIVDVSDIRLKENIHPLKEPLRKLTSLNGFSFQMRGDEKHTTEYGVSAQDVQKVFPELVHQIDEDGSLGVSYDGLIAPMIEAIKEQQAQIEVLRARIDELEARDGPVTASNPEDL
ncbi:MAG: tail fiber domain-containing protein [Gammaproteobacteria bacterium]|uniref:tail fiber domain-containing protein n=1 Tax=Thioclava marina TaxID=1915077 RepID=UPI0011BA920A|nr:tail fiber domain-containing protein [Thioclava marina]MBD3754135.1 tail fiber domain-containing protein [Gammaproteobacteria bacterium]